MSIKVVSWNILHIVHEKNYVGDGSLVISAFQDEKVRVEEIVKYLVSLYLSSDQVVINLQEVPGDVLDELKKYIFAEHLTWHTYPRMPKLKVPNGDPYTNMSESLVSIVKTHNQVLKTDVIDFASGKAALVNSLSNGLNIYNVHMPFEYAQTVTIDNHAIVTGDFNCGIEESKKMFPNFEACPNKSHTFITRRNNVVSTNMYDHILLNFVSEPPELTVVETNLSDHFPVYASVNY